MEIPPFYRTDLRPTPAYKLQQPSLPILIPNALLLSKGEGSSSDTFSIPFHPKRNDPPFLHSLVSLSSLKL